jgi:5-methylcytosine-specific restriction endonuclease McrA
VEGDQRLLLLQRTVSQRIRRGILAYMVVHNRPSPDHRASSVKAAQGRTSLLAAKQSRVFLWLHSGKHTGVEICRSPPQVTSPENRPEPLLKLPEPPEPLAAYLKYAENAALNRTVLGTFPEDVVRQAWSRSRGYCECTRTSHGHRVPCGKPLVWENRGRQGTGAWEAHHRVSQDAGGPETVDNCEILCWDCHSRTL